MDLVDIVDIVDLVDNLLLKKYFIRILFFAIDRG